MFIRGKYLMVGGAILVLTFLGCAIKPHYLKIHPNITAITPPKSVVILPFANIMGFAAANETANSIFTSGFTKKGYCEKVIEPSSALATLAKPEIAEAVTKLRSQFVSTSVINKEAVKSIGNAYEVDAIIWGDLTKWVQDSIGDKQRTQVGISIKMVEVKSGELLWTVMHTHSKESGKGLLGFGGPPSYESVCRKLVDILLENYPFQPEKK